jgi:predicted ABC-type ATPase
LHLVVLAGPNGAGKTTFFDTFLAPTGIRFVNADRIAARMRPADPGSVAYAAARRADRERRKLVADRVPFCMETVFSDPAGDKLAFLRSAQTAGYAIELVFIGLESIELSMARVMQRIDSGGHDVPDDRLVARYPRTLANLREALPSVDRAVLLDNSSADRPYRHVGTVEAGRIVARGKPMPDWARQVLEPLPGWFRVVRGSAARAKP